MRGMVMRPSFATGWRIAAFLNIGGISSALGVWTEPPTAAVPARHSGRGAPATRHDYGKQRPMSVLEQSQLTFAGSLQLLQNEKAFRAFLRPLFRQNWVVYAKPPLRRSPSRPRLSRPLHPSRRHHQRSPRRLRKQPSHLSLERLCPRKSQEDDDSFGAGILAPLPASCTPPGFCPHSLLRLPGQSLPRYPPAPLSTFVIGQSTTSGTVSGTLHSRYTGMLPLSKMCHPHAASGISFCMGSWPTHFQECSP
jgi:hypothetical protein